jgi:hypothetical protein
METEIRQTLTSTTFREKLSFYIKNHKVFTGIFIAFVVGISWQIATLNSSFKTNDFTYPLAITLGSFFALIKVFLMAYNNVEDAVENGRFLSLIVCGGMLFGQIWLIFSAIASLIIDAYPNEFFTYSLYAFGLFILSLIIGQVRSLTKISILAGTSLGLSTLLIVQLFFVKEILFLQITSMLYLGFELLLAILTAREYFKND